MALPLDETITEGQAAHIADHETIAEVLNVAFGGASPTLALSGTFSPLTGWIAGRYYRPMLVASVAPLTMTQNRIYYIPLPVPGGTSIDRIGVEVTTEIATSIVRVGAYANSGGVPSGLPLFEIGTPLDSASTGAKEATIDEDLPGGLIWIACKAENGGPTIRGAANISVSLVNIGGATLANAVQNTYGGWQETGSAGALTTPGTLTQTTSVPFVAVRKA